MSKSYTPNPNPNPPIDPPRCPPSPPGPGPDPLPIKEQIAGAFNEPGLGDTLKRLNANKSARGMRIVKPEVIELDSDYNASSVPPPGSVMLFWAPRGSELLGRLRDAFRGSDKECLNEITEEIVDLVSKRSVAKISDVVAELCVSPSYFDLRYGGKTLAPNLALPAGISFAGMAFAYNGGELDLNEFRIIEFIQDDVSEQFDLFLIKRDPHLSDLEKRVLEAVPNNMLELNIASTFACPLATVVIVLIITAITVAGKSCFGFHDRLAEVILTDEMVNTLGAPVSARRLLDLRRAVFEEYAV